MSETTFSFDTRRVKAFIQDLPPNMSRETYDSLYAVCEDIRDLAKALCPVDTGSLRASGRLEVISKSGIIHQIGIRFGGYITNPKTSRIVDYAAAVETGTSRTPAQPYLRPAFYQYERSLATQIAKALGNAVKESI